MWLVILEAVIYAIGQLLLLLLETNSIDELPVTDPRRKALAKAFKQCDLVRTQAIRIGLPFTAPEVQNVE
jgi:hypothetical protein